MKTKISAKSLDKRKVSQYPFFSKSSGSGFFPVQAKLNIGQPGDKYEQEADRVADAVVQSKSPVILPDAQLKKDEKSISENITPLIQHKIEERGAVQMQPMEEEEEIQTKLLQKSACTSCGKTDVPELQESPLTLQMSPLSHIDSCGGQALPDSARGYFESRIGYNFSDVRIHTCDSAVQMNQQLGAQAFTYGNNVFFNKNKYSPDTFAGKKLLAHELTHVVQQSKGDGNMIRRQISTPLDAHVKNADESKDVAFKVNKVNIIVKPDTTSDKKELENRAKTSFNVSNNNSPSAQTKSGKIVKIDPVPVPTFTVQTVYGKNASESDTSAYGKGTTKDDIKAGHTSLGYHEGSHGTDYLTYIKNNPVPQFNGTVGMTIKEYKKAQDDYQKAWDKYVKDMDSYSENLTDCVGTKASFCPQTP